MASAVVQLQFYEDFLKEPYINGKPKKKTPRKTANKLKRQREYLTGEEIDALKKAARSIGRYGLRDELIISMMYHHGLRVSEAVKLQFHQVDFKTALLHVRRSKNGTPSTHPINGDDLRKIRQLRRANPHGSFIFSSMTGTMLTTRRVQAIIAEAGKKAGIGFPVSSHNIRHGTGYYLANKGTDTRTIQHYLGHRNIASTVVYTQLSSKKFIGLWDN